MSELPAEIPAADPPEPRYSASGIVVRAARDGSWVTLLARRSRRSRFMPGNLVFPGGAVDPEDRPGEPGAHARCVSREVREEAGLELPPGDWLPAGKRTTPAMFPVRFHNRFFLTGAPDGWLPPVTSPAPNEIESLHLYGAGEALEEWAAGNLAMPPPVLPILRVLSSARTMPLTELARKIAETNAQEQRAPRIEFLPDVWMLPQRTATLPPASHTNTWMPGGRRFVIVDPGSTEQAETRRLIEVIERRREQGGEPQAILLTHGHRDHAGGVAPLARALDLPVRADASVLRRLDVEGLPLNEGDELDLDGLTLRVHLTPGHAPGHLAFALPERRALIAGDLVGGMSTILIDPDHGDMGEYLNSLTRMRELGLRTLLPGHGPPLPAKALDRLIEHRGVREGRILQRLSVESTRLSEIASAAYAELPEMPPSLTERQTLAHLLHLQRKGLARRHADGGWILGESS